MLATTSQRRSRRSVGKDEVNSRRSESGGCRNRPPHILCGVSAPGISRYRCESPEDRKSTRLNSSHLVISYAVFCLKKKNLQIEVPAGRLVIGDPHRPRTKASARPVCRAVVPGRAHDRGVRRNSVQLLGLRERTGFHEGGGPEVLRAIHLRVEVGCLWHLP